MNSGRYVLSQVLDLVDRKSLSRLVQRCDKGSKVRHFGCRQQLICMAIAQLTWREGLRDIATCLNARPETLYHLGFREKVAKSTLARRQRAEGLSTLGGSCSCPHAQGECSLRRRGSRTGTGEYGLRSGFHHGRSLPSPRQTPQNPPG
ncbi:MAG: DUF4372 domain-containing protein [Verrucomicrobia bacterium]|nr:DUF4372 domain-containing protein [Verrucomicrobiota bacterium]